MTMKILGVIPARYASTRFPGKPLAMIAGKSMIQRVYEQALKASNLDQVVVATDDVRISDHVNSFGGKVVMTSVEHPNGTARCKEAMQIMNAGAEGLPFEGIVNIQGDEPYIHPDQISSIGEMLMQGAEIATLAKQLDEKSELFNPNVVKVVFDNTFRALYFSRQAIPFLRDDEQGSWIQQHHYYRHIGIYGYSAGVLERIVTLKESPLEQAEKLEQLRWLENGFKIRVGTTTRQSIAVDTPDDLSKLTNIS